MKFLKVSAHVRSICQSVFLIAALGACSKPPAPTPEISAENQAKAEATKTQEVKPLSAEQRQEKLDKAIELALNTVYFDFDSAQLTEGARESLDKMAEAMKVNPGVKLRIEGNTDSRGTGEYNLALAEKRADAIKQYLVSLGIPAASLETVSNGEEKPAVQGENEDAWSKNRRGEFVRL